jgi:hypothetical protein
VTHETGDVRRLEAELGEVARQRDAYRARALNLRRRLTAQPAPSGWQQRVQEWMLACFGQKIATDRLERCDRFCEEALELLQSFGYRRERVIALISYVYGRYPGESTQEVGGVMVTLAALCSAHDIDVDAAREKELARVWTKVDQIREKQKAKPTGSALPVAVDALPPAPAKPIPWGIDPDEEEIAGVMYRQRLVCGSCGHSRSRHLDRGGGRCDDRGCECSGWIDGGPDAKDAIPPGPEVKEA